MASFSSCLKTFSYRTKMASSSSGLKNFSHTWKPWFITRNLCKYEYLDNFLTRSKSTYSRVRGPLQDLEEVEKIMGYHFNNTDLLHEAFTHPSLRDDFLSYDWLLYLGNSILKRVITQHQFFAYPSLHPGCLRRLCDANVNAEKLARAAINHNLHKYLRHCQPDIDMKIQLFVQDVLKYPGNSYGLVNPPKVLADVIQSTIGAVFVDSNHPIDTTRDHSIDTTWEVTKILLDPIITPDTIPKDL